MKNQEKIASEEHSAKAKANDLHISTKHSVEICRYLRYKTTEAAKKFLEEVIALKKPVPFKRYKRNVGHKAGMAAGRYPQKAANEVLKLVKAAETNAQFKGLNTSNLKITKILANKASIPLTGRRHRTATKRTHLEIEVMETKEKKTERTLKGKIKPEIKEKDIKEKKSEASQPEKKARQVKKEK